MDKLRTFLKRILSIASDMPVPKDAKLTFILLFYDALFYFSEGKRDEELGSIEDFSEYLISRMEDKDVYNFMYLNLYLATAYYLTCLDEEFGGKGEDMYGKWIFGCKPRPEDIKYASTPAETVRRMIERKDDIIRWCYENGMENHNIFNFSPKNIF